MTDVRNESSTDFNHTRLEKESRLHGDMKFQNINSGVQFGLRYLFQLVHAVKNYHFDYLLRLDDDVFFCMKMFLRKVNSFPTENYHWGYVHCGDPYKVRPDESVILFSSDLVLKFLSQDPLQMKCHPFADQMVGTWVQELNLSHVLRHDLRIHHHPPIVKVPELRKMKSVCNAFVAIHGAYVFDILLFWKLRGRENIRQHDTTVQCPSTMFDWTKFGYWMHEPKPCIQDPTWNISRYSTRNGEYLGRQYN